MNQAETIAGKEPLGHSLLAVLQNKMSDKKHPGPHMVPEAVIKTVLPNGLQSKLLVLDTVRIDLIPRNIIEFKGSQRGTKNKGIADS